MSIEDQPGKLTGNGNETGPTLSAKGRARTSVTGTEAVSSEAVEEGAVGSIDILRIMEMIPHRHPFLMIDKVEDVRLHESAVGTKNVSYNEHFFQGHFPVQPVMPGVLIVESMAQTAAVLVVASLGKEAEGKPVFFMSIDNARFRRPVVPGDVLRLNCKIIRHRGNVWKFEGRAMVDDKLVAEAGFSAMIVDN